MAENAWEAYKEKYGTPLADQQKHGIIAPVERNLQNLWGLGQALRDTRAYLTGDLDPIESGTETPVFTEPLHDWASKLPHGSAVAGLIPETRGDALIQGAALAIPAAQWARGPTSLALASQHPAYTERIGALGGKVAKNLSKAGRGAPAPAPAAGPIGRVPRPTGGGTPKAAPGTWQRAGEDLAQSTGEIFRPSSRPSVIQEVKKALYNTTIKEMQETLSAATGWDWLAPEPDDTYYTGEPE
ncbi:MAG: hypothetical protein GTO63_15760 [Anaerolineae bacterium]|nr:hypothetical protein [Anaerolineae bacterium]NIN96285.1 hypothetical protein [Anaerolineae bacterium]NIQ79305.1 hypothetical protein [Anaerolineae bacterium]